MAAANLLAIGRRIGRDVTADDVEPLTWFLAEHGPRGHRRRAARRAAARWARSPAGSRSGGPTAGTSCSRRRSASCRPSSACSRRPTDPVAGFGRSRHVHAVHPGREPDRPTGDLAPGRAERERPAGRRALRRRVRPGGPAAPGRRARGAVGRLVAPARADACLSGAPSVRLGGGQGFYGDTPRAVAGLLDDGVDYLCLEALAELTLAILPEGPGARRVARVHPRPPALPRRRAAGGARRAHEGHHERRRHQPARRRARRDRDGTERRALSGLKIATVMGDDLMPRLDARARRDRVGPRERRDRRPVRHHGRRRAVLRGLPRRVPDRRGARPGRRHRDHRPGRRRRALPRAAHPRARLGPRRLGPARGGRPRRAPARVLGPGRGRQLQRRLVDDPRAVEPAVPDRGGRGRRHRGDHQAGRIGRAGRRRHRPPPAALRGARPGGVPRPGRRRRLRVRARSPTSATTACRSPTCAAGPPPTPTRRCSRTRPGWSGETRVAFSWPDAAEKAKALDRDLHATGRDGRDHGRRLGGGALGRERARRRHRAGRPRPSRPSAWRGSRGAAPTNAAPRRSDASSCPSR